MADAGGACASRREEQEHVEGAPGWSIWAPTETPGTPFHMFCVHTGADVVSATTNESGPRRRVAPDA